MRMAAVTMAGGSVASIMVEVRHAKHFSKNLRDDKRRASFQQPFQVEVCITSNICLYFQENGLDQTRVFMMENGKRVLHTELVRSQFFVWSGLLLIT